MATFMEFCARHRVTNRERDELAWHLAMSRARALYRVLRPGQPWNRPTREREG